LQSCRHALLLALLELDRRSQDDSGSESDLEIDSSPEGSHDEEEKWPRETRYMYRRGAAVSAAPAAP
jgi:hypothetical protein